jgi:hypothetical protein
VTTTPSRLSGGDTVPGEALLHAVRSAPDPAEALQRALTVMRAPARLTRLEAEIAAQALLHGWTDETRWRTVTVIREHWEHQQSYVVMIRRDLQDRMMREALRDGFVFTSHPVETLHALGNAELGFEAPPASTSRPAVTPDELAARSDWYAVEIRLTVGLRRLGDDQSLVSTLASSLAARAAT